MNTNSYTDVVVTELEIMTNSDVDRLKTNSIGNILERYTPFATQTRVKEDTLTTNLVAAWWK